ncbi:hypothetical protein OJAV_G00106510 [Oryzias javanicus]|uniref:Tubulin epsilon and delta complex protein 1 domain-containing protein n=1 Tax=Oryzias javanicus TaxID=123683 RepID=A0A437CTT3_ORYJA|nr:hypothetical protein OJAV_G00106510 [Oryzias javanicus]
MQRGGAVNVQVKQLIQTLRRLLVTSGLDDVPTAEAFRQAKFGGRLEEEQFWKLVENLLRAAGAVSSPVKVQLKAERRKLVTTGLWQTGYHAHWMFENEAEGGRFSCRDLLLALGWLLATGTLEKLLVHQVQHLDKMLLTPVFVKSELCSELQFDSASLRRLQWLFGSLRHQRRSLLSLINVRTEALYKVLAAGVSSSSPGQSCSEALQKDCVGLQKLCDLLDLYVKWKEAERVFWTWMDSVVMCHLRESHAEPSSQTPGRSVTACCHGNQALERLEGLLLRFSTEQDSQNYHVEPKKGGGAKQRREASSSSSQSLPSSPVIPAVCLVKLQTDRAAKQSSRTAENRHELPACRAAELLRSAEEQLLQRRHRQRLANRMQLQDWTGRLDQLVIPL